MADSSSPSFSLPLAPEPKGQFPPKGLNLAPFRTVTVATRKKAWEDVLEFLQTTRRILFTSEDLPQINSLRELHVPEHFAPSLKPAGKIAFGLEEEWGLGIRDQFIFIEDVCHLTYQVWQTILEEEPLFEKKKRILLKNSQQDPEKAEAWLKRLEEVNGLKEELDAEIKPLKLSFQADDLSFSFLDGVQQINYSLSKKLLEWRFEQSHGGEFRNSLDTLIKYCQKLVTEAGYELAELPDGEAEAEVSEVVEETPPEPPNLTPLLPTSEAAPEVADQAGGTDPDQPANRPPPPYPSPRPTNEETPSTLQDIELNNLRTITIETERLSRIFLYQLAAQYGLPPELLQNDMSGFRDVMREDMRQWIVKKLKAGELDALYDPTAIRERQLLVARFGEVLSRDGRFDLFQKILLEHHQRLNSDPVQQAAFRAELENGNFQNPDTWKSLLENFANGMLDTASDPQSQVATNPKEHIATALKSSLSSLATTIGDLGITDLNLEDSPQVFNERFTNIVNRIDVMVALRFAPIYLETLGREHFQDTFNIKVSESEYRSLVFILQTYWDVRERSFSEQGVNLNYVLEGLDINELEDWIQYMPSMSKEEYYNRYLERIDYFAEVGLRVGGFHRVVMALAPLSKKTKKTGDTDSDTDADEDDDEPDLEDLKKQNAVNKIKLEVMRDSLAYAFSELPDDAKRAVYNQIDPSQTDEWLKTGYFPVEISFDDLNLIAQYANELGITSPVADDAIANAGGWANDPSVGPMPNVANRAAGSIRNAKNRYHQFQKAMAKRRKKVAKQAAKKAAQATTKATAEVGLNAIGTALGLPGLGTVLVNIWYAIPEQLRPVLGFLLVTAPLALVGGLAGWLFGLPSWFGNVGSGIGSFFKGLFNPKSASAAVSNAGSAFQSAGASNAAAVQAVAAPTPPIVAKVVMGIHPAAQAILISTGLVGVSTLLNYMIVTNAFLANFPLPEEDKSINEKISKYVALEKTVTVPAPCDQTTLKCPELSGDESYEVTYTIKLTLKGDYTISINKVKDEITAKFSKKKFEELNQPLPANIVITKVVIPSTETGSRSDFEELTTDPNDERNIIRPGEELIITYVETYDSAFNNSQVRNIFHAEFFYVDGDQSGNDFVETAKAICIGDCSQEEGCWPATGVSFQGPWGVSSHNLNGIGVDAYDISDPFDSADKFKELGVPMEKMSNPPKIYSPFVAQACYPPASATYGNYVVLTTKDWVYWLGHMISRAQESGCQQVQPGDIIGVMGSTGKSTGTHSHFELRTLDGAVTVGRPEDPLGEQMPPSLLGNKPPKTRILSAVRPTIPEYDYIGSCYDMD